MLINSFSIWHIICQVSDIHMNRLILFLAFFISLPTFGQDKKTVTIKGFAPAYVGAELELFEIEDYLSMKERSIAKTSVKSDSTFSMTFFAEETQRIVIRANRNKTFFYINPGTTYDIYIPDKDPYEPYRPNGNLVEVTFFELDSTDINYKILSFLRWQDDFLGNNFVLKTHKPMEFAKKVDEFKANVEKAYSKDTADVFFRTYVRFSIAQLDNMQYAAERNRYEKHDFYLKNFPVSYRNDAYMSYFSSFYEKMIPRLSMETNNRVYLGVLKSSPTLVMRALGSEYTLINVRIREMVMIKALSESFYTNDFPQTNILTILDSVANHSLFAANGVIARNTIARLTDLVPGGKCPDFAIMNSNGEIKTLASYSGKFLYIHFLDPSGEKSTLQIEPLLKLHEKYKEDVTFISVSNSSQNSSDELSSIPWEKFNLEPDNAFFGKMKVQTFPQYVLIDETGHVVAAPALTPLPNGQYETIDKTFFFIREAHLKMKDQRR